MPAQTPQRVVTVPTFAQTRTWLFSDNRARQDAYAVSFAALANQVASVHRNAKELAEMRYRHITEGETVEFARRTQYALRERLTCSVREVVKQVPKTREDFALFGARTSALRQEGV